MKKITHFCIALFIILFTGNIGGTYAANLDAESNNNANEIQRVRIDFVSPDKYTRHLLLAFTPDNAATDGFDYGYDALNPDNFRNDLNWMIEEKRYIIQGVGAFDETKQYPFGLFLGDSGDIEIILTGLENFDSEIDVYIYDLFLDTYTRINDDSFKMNIDAADYLNRFFIAFQAPEVIENPIDDDEIETSPIVEVENTSINYLNKTNEIYIQVPNTVNVKQVYLINLLGQIENSWNSMNVDFSNEIKIPVKNISNGVYIIKVETNTGIINKKVLVRQ
ncbi:MAG: T9SS type A sorting domain-containing protein [Bacteroidetes bacterium]|nr:T9SS type A sorting domain-containing protein [Bacteroidota bacterium]